MSQVLKADITATPTPLEREWGTRGEEAQWKGSELTLTLAAGQGRISQQRADEKRKKERRQEWKCSLQELRILSRKFLFDSLRNAEPHRGWW